MSLKQMHPALTCLGLLSVALLLGAPLAVTYQAGKAEAQLPPAEPHASQGMTVDTSGPVQSALVRLVPGRLPAPIPGQRRPPCDAVFEKEFNGGCWLPLAVEECPAERGGFLHEGKCYLRALAPARQPSSGEPAPQGVANP